MPIHPNKNGVIQREHKHLLELTRFLMFQSNLPKVFWGDSVLMMTFINNRLLSSILGWKAPFEMLYNKNTQFYYLTVFGCLCYTTNALHTKINFLHTHKRVFSLDIFVHKRHIRYMILIIQKLWFLGMLFSMKINFYIKIIWFSIE